MRALRVMDLRRQSCFVMVIRALGKHILGSKDEPQGVEEKEQVLTSRDFSCLVIDYLCDQAGGQNATVACFYFDFAARKEQSLARMLGCLLRQLVFGLEEIPEEISQAYKERQNAIGGQGPQISTILKMMQAASAKKRAIICIDALDECATEHLAKLLDSLSQIIQQSPDTRIFVTGRPHILHEIGRRLAGRVASLLVSPRRDDITRYIYTRLAADITSDAMDSNLQTDILGKIPENISEMYVAATILQKLGQLCTDKYIYRFLLVSLNIDAILEEPTIYGRRQKLSAMTDGLGLEGAYGETLGRINDQGGARARLGMAALMWISYAERPLKVVELCHALAVEIGAPNLNIDGVPSIATVLTCCQGLVAVDEKASTARLIHFTLQEYLRAHPNNFGAVHSTMAETCLSYLNSYQVKTLSASPTPDLETTPFLEYSSVYWGVHARRDVSDCVKQLALKLFDDNNNHMPTLALLGAQKGYSDIQVLDFRKPLLFSGLHYASLFGIVEIVIELIEVEGCDINQRDGVYNTPLVWAARNGHERVVEILLKRGDIIPDKPGNSGQTPLWNAALGGHEGVMKMLLKRKPVNPDAPDIYGQRPLWVAAVMGHKAVVQMLLARDDVYPDEPKNDGQTPLHCAATSGHTGVVKMLLERDDVHPDKRAKGGLTPLHCAALNGHLEVVKMLLERDDIHPEQPNNESPTLLYIAAVNGQVEVVKMLLEREDVHPGKANHGGIAPLHCATFNGRIEVVKMLLERDDVHPDKSTNEGQTPLHFASANGQAEVVKMLLEREDVYPDKSTKEGQTPLQCAAANGHAEVVKMLLERDDVYPDKPDNGGLTPLYCATLCGHTEVVKMLLERDDVYPDKPNNGGITPLYCAASNGHVVVVKMLLEREDVHTDKPTNEGQTPLYIAAANGSTEVVKMLLERDDVHPAKLNNGGQAPLYCAAYNGHVEVVKMLLKRDDVHPGTPANDSRTPLHVATFNGHVEVVKALLERDDVHPDEPDNDGLAPLHFAAVSGHVEAVKMLLERDDVHPDKPTNDGRTPLHCAALKGHVEVVKTLLENDHIDPDKRARGNVTPLDCAIGNGHVEVVKIILEWNAVHRDQRGALGRRLLGLWTPLLWLMVPLAFGYIVSRRYMPRR